MISCAGIYAKKGINVTSISLKQKADIFLSEIKKIKNHYRLKIIVRNKIFYFNIFNIFNNLVSNILACVSVLSLLNLDLSIMKRKFAKFTIPHGRGDISLVSKFNKKFRFIDESYNANPLSMSSAIKNMNYYKIKKSLSKYQGNLD